jgi:hypothetical protein
MAQPNRVQKRREVSVIYRASISVVLKPKRRCNGPSFPLGHRGSEAIQQTHDSANGKDVDPASVGICPMKKKTSMPLQHRQQAPRIALDPREKTGSATEEECRD